MTSTAQGVKDNRRKYQGNEYIKDLGLSWMDFNARQYDPQIGRFLAVDPLADAEGQQIWSPYAAMGNAPESMVDPNGTFVSIATESLLETIRTLNLLSVMFGAENVKFENGRVVFANLYAAKVNFGLFMKNGDGGGDAAAKESMVFIGQQILAAQADGENNIQIGYGSNGLDIVYSGGSLSETEIIDQKPALTYEFQHATAIPGLTYTSRGYTDYGERVVARERTKLNYIFTRYTPLGKAVAVAISLQEINREDGFLYSKGGRQNIWPDQYGPPPNPAKVNWTKSDSQLADEKADAVGDSKKGPNSAHNKAKKWFRDKRPN